MTLLHVFWTVVTAIVLYMFSFTYFMDRVPKPLWGEPAYSVAAAMTGAGMVAAGVATLLCWFIVLRRKDKDRVRRGF